MSQCPECKSVLKADAVQCACGWKREERNEPPRVACAYCVQPAKMKVRIGSDLWVHTCKAHYQQVADQHLDYIGTKKRACQERRCMARAIPGTEFCEKHTGVEVERVRRPSFIKNRWRDAA